MKKRWLKWLRHLFVTFHFFLYSTILLASAALYVAFRPDGLEILNTYLLEPFGIHYSHAEGTLIEGFTLHNVRNDKSSAKTLTLRYNLVKMLEGEHTVDSIHIDGLQIHLDDFLKEDNTPWPFPIFKLREVSITNLQLISSYPIELDLHAKEGTYDGDILNFASINATFKSRYASGAVRGAVRHNSIIGIGDLYPNALNLAPYSARFTTLPRSLRVTITELSDTKALLQTSVTRLDFKQNSDLSANGVKVDLHYRYDDDYFDINATYLLKYAQDSMQTSQHLRYALNGTTTTSFNGQIHSTHPLPANALHGELTDTPSDGMKGLLTLGGTTLHLSSHDYDRFIWDMNSNHQNLGFVTTLPEVLRKSPLSMKSRGIYTLSTDTLNASGDITHEDFLFHGSLTLRHDHKFLEGNLTLPPDAPIWKSWSHKPPEHLRLSLADESNTTRLNLSGASLGLSAALAGKHLKGSGNYLGAFFDLTGTQNGDTTRITIDTVIPSLFASVSKLRPIELQKNEYYDAEIRAKTELTLTNTLHMKNDITIPWYAAVLDSQRSFGGTDGHLSMNYDDGNITLNRYRLEVAGHPLSSDKPSHLHISPSGGLVVDEMWIYDSLRLNGVIGSDLSASLHLHSDKFTYKGPEGNAHASADITFERDAHANQNLSGNIHILDATITYLPIQQFKVMDDDIIIIQDVRPPSTAKLAINLHITARQPIAFKTKELDLKLDPDVTLWKDPTAPMQILGMVTIPSGTATTSGKEFTIKKSEIYFGGDIPLNPYLDLTIEHDVDYKKILIYVTHTLESPIFLFTSDPAMSQNDIMSYILFGTPSNSLPGGDNSTSGVRADATNFMLGAGLKGLIHGATKLQIDTMNILTTAEGGMGFEVGAKLNKDLRVLYKNDTVSSVMVQYTLNKWLRIDADIHELGQGIKAVYIKDFHDFLPHNKRIKK